MTFAAKQLDMIVGVDVHMIQPPGPVPPVPVPHPYVGMVSDAGDQSAATVLINGMARAKAGQLGQAQPPHIPMGGTFVMPVFSESEIQMGSSTVIAEGESLSLNGQPVISCQDAGGAPAPPRAWKKMPAKSPMMAPMCSLISIPAGMPVLVGGAPTVMLPGNAQPPKSQYESVMAKAQTSEANPESDEWFDLEKKDLNGEPIAGQWFEIMLPSGEKQVARLNAFGKSRYHGLDAGDCEVRFLKGASQVEINLFDQSGSPCEGARYEVRRGDEVLAQGTLDERGHALVEGVPPSACQVVFPDLEDQEA